MCGLLLVVIVALIAGVDSSGRRRNVPSADLPPATSAQEPAAPAGDQRTALIATVLASTEDLRRARCDDEGDGDVGSTLVLYSGQVRSACGLGRTAMGPFYCGAVQRVCIDLAFCDELRRRFRARGEFAQA